MKLEANGAIQGYHAVVSDQQSVLLRALIFIKIAARPCDQALDWLSTLEGVQEVTSLSGDIDAIVKCALSNPNDLAKLNDKIGSNNLIASSHSYMILRHIR